MLLTLWYITVCLVTYTESLIFDGQEGTQDEGHGLSFNSPTNSWGLGFMNTHFQSQSLLLNLW
jgi:hypothetical protein